MFDEGIIFDNWEARLANAQADPAAARAMLIEEHFRVDDPIDALIHAFVRRPELDADLDEDEGGDEVDQELQDAVLDLLEQKGLDPENLLDGTAIGPPCDNGPVNEHALDDEEQTWLEGFLNSRQVPETTMSLDELNGFFTALVIDPNPIMPGTYTKEVWGTDDGEGPVYSSEEQLRFVLDLLTRHWNAIAASFASEAGPAPLLRKHRGEDDGLAWASGFLRGMHVDREVWERLAGEAEGDGGLLFGPIAILSRTSDDDDLPDNLRDEDTRQNAIFVLPEILASMYRYFRANGFEAGLSRKPRPERRQKVGRNQPCPCGSGRKYKVCCGAAGADKTPPQIRIDPH